GAVWCTPFWGLSQAAQELMAVLGAVVTWWITEATPLPVTALLGPTFCVLGGGGPAKEVVRSFAEPIIFLFLGSFLLAEAMLHHGLNRRIAFHVLGWPIIGENPARPLFAFCGLTGLLSVSLFDTASAVRSVSH